MSERDESALALVEARASMVAEAQAALELAIRQAHQAGWPIRAVAERAGLSAGKAHQIIRAGS